MPSRAPRRSGASAATAGPPARPTSRWPPRTRNGRTGGSAISPASSTAPGQGHVVSVYVAPSHRATGLAGQMLDGVVAWARGEAGLDRLHLYVHEDNARAHAFYRRYGFTETGRRDARTSSARARSRSRWPCCSTGRDQAPARLPRMLPWRADLAGRLDEGVIDSALLRDNPLGDPHERPVWVYLPPGYDDGRRALPERLRHPGLHRARGDVGQPHPVPAAVRRDRRPGLRRRRPRRPASSSTSTRGRRTAARSSSTRPGTGRYHSYLCDEVVPWVDARYRTIADRGVAGDQRQVQRRLRRDDHPDAAAGPVRRAGHPRRRHALRVLLPAGVRPGGALPASVRRRHLALVGRLPRPGPPSPRRRTQR